MDTNLTTSVRYIPRVGPVIAKKLKTLGIETVQNLIYYLPFRYNDFSLITPISRIRPNITVTVRGTVQRIANIRTKHGKQIQQALVQDSTGFLQAVWFNQPFLVKNIIRGDTISLSGQIKWFGAQLVMESPEYELGKYKREGLYLHTGRLVPVYSETKGITSKWLRSRIAYILPLIQKYIIEHLPLFVIESFHVSSIKHALFSIHFPKTFNEADRARRRLAFDELLIMLLRAHNLKRQWEMTQTAYPCDIIKQKLDKFISNLPFTLTSHQQTAVLQIVEDLKRTIPMNRLLEGDVGAGKTVVATIASYIVKNNNLKTIVMAPTQILAEQHFQTIQTLLSPYKTSVELITGACKNPVKDGSGNQADILIGTHALLHRFSEYPDTGLIVIDEQQRFGVRQRALLKKKGKTEKTPHLLTMTATPIPRTVALTQYGNLDLSLLTILPKGRKKIQTWVVPKQKRLSAYNWIRKQIQKNNSQAFIVCPFIEESETLSSVKAAKKEFTFLSHDIFPDLNLSLLHGKLKAKEKTEVLDKFRKGLTHILVSTPVVEVGIDIQDATIMLIEGAERFGLSQLHQLRGRVGRGEKKSYCLLFTESDNEKTLERLHLLESSHSGPVLAEYDLELRGPGEIFGTRQHGLTPLALLSLSDKNLVLETQKAKELIIQKDPDLDSFPILKNKVKEATIDTITQD